MMKIIESSSTCLFFDKIFYVGRYYTISSVTGYDTPEAKLPPGQMPCETTTSRNNINHGNVCCSDSTIITHVVVKHDGQSREGSHNSTQ